MNPILSLVGYVGLSLFAFTAAQAQPAGPADGGLRRQVFPDSFGIRRRPGGESWGRLGELPVLGSVEYSHDYNPDFPTRLREFTVHGDDPGERLPNARVRWFLTSELQHEELFPLFGEIYRWDGIKGRFSRIPDHPLAIPTKDPRTRFAVSRSIVLNHVVGGDSGVTVNLERFGHGIVHARPVTCVLAWIGCQDDNALQELGRQPGSTRRWYWLTVGDHIRTSYWDLYVKRIDLPNSDEKIRGWVEFEFGLGPKSKP